MPTFEAGRRHQVDPPAVQPHPVLRGFRLEPARQAVGGLNQQELAVIVPHAAAGGGEFWVQDAVPGE